MLTRMKFYATLLFSLGLVWGSTAISHVYAQPPRESTQDSRGIATLVTVQGTVQFEGASNHSGIKVEMWRDGTHSGTIGVVNTDISGSYLFTNVDSSYSYWVVAAASVDGYAYDGTWVYSSDLGSSGGIYTAPPLRLLRPRRFAIDWGFQPDGSTSFVSGSPTSGIVTLESTTDKWIALATIMSVGQNNGFCFSSASTTGCQDFYVGNTNSYPTTLWANNGLGGIHDMGEVEFPTVTQAPDKSNGVGPGQFYNNQNTPAIIGHTYVVVAQDGNHYAKFRITAIAVTAYKIYFPLIAR